MDPDQIAAIQKFMDETAAWLKELSETSSAIIFAPLPVAPVLDNDRPDGW